MWSELRPAAVVVALAASVASANDLLADFDVLCEKLPDVHADWFRTLDEASWDRAVSDLRSRIVSMPNERALFELSALCALAGDAHTGVDLQGSGIPLMAMPLGFEAFDDGVFVVLAGPLESGNLAAKLTAVNSVPTGEVIERIGRLIATDNPGRLRRQAAQLMTLRGALWAAGVIDGPVDAVTLTLRPLGSADEVERKIRFADSSMLHMIRWQRSPDFTSITPPMYLRRASGNYQSDYDETSKTLYIAYNRCAEADDLPMERFAHMVLGFWDRLKPERLLIDLRHNGGGNERVLGPLIDAIDGHPEIDQPGRLFVATGPRTFSSAVNNAVTLNQTTEAVTVGEPSGGSPNHFGEVKQFELPSGIRVFYSTKYFDRVEGDPAALLPELDAPRSSEHWFAGRDPVLEAVTSYTVPGVD